MLNRSDYLLRPVVESDLDLMLLWRNSERIRACMYSDHLISVEEHRAWYQKVSREEFPSVLIFEYRGRPVGVKSFSQIDRHNSRCFWGFYLGEAEIPRGSGSVMGYLAQKYIFSVHNFHKLCAEAFAYNEPSLRYHRRLGFKEEGHFAQHIKKSGCYHDIVCFGILREDWLKQRDDLEQKVFALGGHNGNH